MATGQSPYCGAWKQESWNENKLEVELQKNNMNLSSFITAY
jgi:hypothetical protein